MSAALPSAPVPPTRKPPQPLAHLLLGALARCLAQARESLLPRLAAGREAYRLARPSPPGRRRREGRDMTTPEKLRDLAQSLHYDCLSELWEMQDACGDQALTDEEAMRSL